MTSPSVIDVLHTQAHSHLLDYVIPGLNSTLLKGVRMFEMTRHQHHVIAPHSHRFDFACYVLEGKVTNKIWVPTAIDTADLYRETVLRYLGTPGNYAQRWGETKKYISSVYTSQAGQWYTMSHDQIHSIHFDKGTKVIFFEGPEVSEESLILEPFIETDKYVCTTGDVQPWMFRKVKND